jgi:hypothetical protein
MGQAKVSVTGHSVLLYCADASYETKLLKLKGEERMDI